MGCGATGNDLKPLCRKGLLVLRRCALVKELTCKRGVLRMFQARERSNLRVRAQGADELSSGEVRMTREAISANL